MCRVCCKVHCAVKVLDCVGREYCASVVALKVLFFIVGHRLVFKTRLEGEKVLEGKAT